MSSGNDFIVLYSYEIVNTFKFEVIKKTNTINADILGLFVTMCATLPYRADGFSDCSPTCGIFGQKAFCPKIVNHVGTSVSAAKMIMITAVLKTGAKFS